MTSEARTERLSPIRRFARHRRGLVGERVTVRVPGGVHEVDLGDTIRLRGPVTHVFDTEVTLA